MPIARYQMPDGRIARVEVPEGTSQDQAQQMAAALMASHMAGGSGGNGPPGAPAADPFSGGPLAAQQQQRQDFQGQMSQAEQAGIGEMSPLDTQLAGIGSRFNNLRLGVKQIGASIQDALDIGQRTPQGQSIENAPPISQTNSQRVQQEIDRAKSANEPVLNTPGGKLGAIIGDTALYAPAALIPGAGAPLISAAIGAGVGAIQPVASGDSRFENALIGGGAGIAAPALGRALSPGINPQARALLDQGVRLTPGQILGGGWKSAEDKLTSVPFFGDMINRGQRGAMEDFNRAAYARALGGAPNPNAPVGREAVSDIEDQLGAQYSNLLPNMSFNADAPFVQGLSQLQGMATQGLAPQQAARFSQIMQNDLMRNMTPHGVMNGESLKNVESRLGELIRSYGGSSNGDDRQLANALREMQSLVRQTVARADPDQAAQLADVNRNWANFTRVRDAAGGIGAKEGVFTPAQLAAAVRRGDTSTGKGDYASGNALMQDLTDSGGSVIGNKYPDSGTVGRALLTGAIGTGAAAGGVAVNPAIAAAAAPALLYTNPGKKLAASLLANRPASVRQLGRIIQENAGTLTPAALALGLRVNQ